MVIVNRQERSSGPELVHNGDKLVDPVTPALNPLKIFLVLGCESEGLHPLLVSLFAEDILKQVLSCPLNNFAAARLCFL